MKSSRRHESLIPLSREHQYGLLLCLRIHQGLARNADEAWVRRKANDAVEFFSSELTSHFKAEEQAVFPAMNNIAEATVLLDELVAEHRKLERLVSALAGSAPGLASSLGEFADLLEAHIRKEERELFPLYEKRVKDNVAAQVGIAVRSFIGDAMQPGNPDLLK